LTRIGKSTKLGWGNAYLRKRKVFCKTNRVEDNKMAEYDLFQKTFRLSMLANLWHQTGTVESLEDLLTKQINNEFADSEKISKIGKWTIQWGPVVFMAEADKKKGVPTNAMYVAHNLQEKAYVVAIAGTNPASLGDWTLDVDITGSVWEYGGGTKETYIAKGARLGLSNLLNMKDRHSNLKINELLFNMSSQREAKIIFTGHSLGGVLSPLLALALLNKYNKFRLSKNSWAGVYVYPTAGFTPGNQEFAELFQKEFPASEGKKPGKQWNSMVINTMDIIPLLWNKNDIKRIEKIYDPKYGHKTSLVVQLAAESMTEKSGMNYKQLSNVTKFTSHLFDITPPNKDKWTSQAILQHIQAYNLHILGEDILSNRKRREELEITSENWLESDHQTFDRLAEELAEENELEDEDIKERIAKRMEERH